jgi:integrase/recombinase XerD
MIKKGFSVTVVPLFARDGGELSTIDLEYQRAKLDYEFFNNFESEHTRKCYRRDILQFFTFVYENFPEALQVGQVERVHVVAYRNWLFESDYAPKSQNRKLSALSSYFDFLVEKGVAATNPVSSVKRPRQEVATPTEDLNDQEILTLFALFEKPDHSPLHKAIIYLLFTTGIRKSELIELKLKDYRQQGEHQVIEVRAKGGKYLTKVIHPHCSQVIDHYLLWMRSINRDVTPEDWIFQPSRNPKDQTHLIKPLRPESIDYIIKKYAKEAGISGRITPHSARASYIGSALESGVDLLRLSLDVGHSSVKTTQEYDKRKKRLSGSPVYKLGFLNEKK